jgi:capsular polysaccharide biosynthesis protein
MMNFLIGFIFGIVVATVGFSGFASFADKQIDSAKEVIRENVK